MVHRISWDMNNKSVRSSISLPEEDHAILQNIAESNQVSLSWLVRKAVRDFLRNADDDGQMDLFDSSKPEM